MNRGIFLAVHHHTPFLFGGGITEEARVSSKGQVVIPKYLRDALGLKEGTTVMMEKVENKLIIIKKPDDPVKELSAAGERVAIKNVRRQIKEE